MPFLLSIGKLVGTIGFYVAKRRRHIITTNIQLCFPNLSKDEQISLIKANFKSLGMAIFETIAAWWKPENQVKQLFTYEGLEHLDQLKKSGQGALLLTIHFCNLELGARAITLQTPFVAMYRQHKNKYFEDAQFKMREQQSKFPPVNRNEIRKTIRHLKNGNLIWYAPDQNYGGTDHCFAPFFDIPALTITATSTLSKLGNAKVLPYYCIRKGNRYHVKILPPLETFPSVNPQDDALRLNALFESWINEAPDQYLWAHRRFKTRPKGEPSVY